MAAAPTYNKAITCLCDNPAEYHCNTCGDTLCSKCKAIHLKSKATSNHSVVPYGERLRPEHLSSLSCPDHKGTECTHWCEKCCKAACMDCVTSTHYGHKMKKLEDILKEKTAMLQRELADLENNKLKEWKDLMEDVKQRIPKYLYQVNGVEKELAARVKVFHAKVDEIFKDSREQLKDIAKRNLVVFHQQVEMVSDGLEKVKQEIKECEDKLRNGSMESLLQYEKKEEGMKATLPKISPVMPPIFSPSEIDTKSMKEMFGKFTEQHTKDGKANTGATSQDVMKATGKGNAALLQGATPKTGASDSKSESTSRINQKNTEEITGPTLPQRHLIATPSVQASFHAGCNSYDQSIACVRSGRAWVRTGDGTLELMDQRGAVKDYIDTDLFDDVVLSPQGELLLSDFSYKCIKSVSPDKVVSKLFRTQWTPYGLCCLHSGDVAVTFREEGRVVIYSRSGKIVQELNKKLFRHPYRVAQNKVNKDLYICDKDGPNISYTGKIIALDTSYCLKYEYTGQGNIDFHPMDLCTDSAGRVLITDSESNTVHILDRDGRFLQYLLTEEQGLWDPVSINVDNDGYAWVGDYHGYVKVVKYLQ